MVAAVRALLHQGGMHLVIKNPAEAGPGIENSGDFHFGAALQRALESQGAIVSQQYWPAWDAPVPGADAVLVLRGRHRYTPPPGELASVWVISHPASVSVDELDQFAIASSKCFANAPSSGCGTAVRRRPT
jgi:hypothetical protein